MKQEVQESGVPPRWNTNYNFIPPQYDLPDLRGPVNGISTLLRQARPRERDLRFASTGGIKIEGFRNFELEIERARKARDRSQ